MGVRLVWHGDLADAKLLGQAPRALRQAAEHLLEESNRIVPIEEGTLMQSGEVDSDERKAVVSYNTIYARRQHEELEWRHAAGRSAKYLEDTFVLNQRNVERWLAEAIDLS